MTLGWVFPGPGQGELGLVEGWQLVTQLQLRYPAPAPAFVLVGGRSLKIWLSADNDAMSAGFFSVPTRLT